MEDIANEMDKFVEMYIKKQSDSLLKKCGLADKVAKIKSHSNVRSCITKQFNSGLANSF